MVGNATIFYGVFKIELSLGVAGPGPVPLPVSFQQRLWNATDGPPGMTGEDAL
jgi:hypothetical protein